MTVIFSETARAPANEEPLALWRAPTLRMATPGISVGSPLVGSSTAVRTGPMSRNAWATDVLVVEP